MNSTESDSPALPESATPPEGRWAWLELAKRTFLRVEGGFVCLLLLAMIVLPAASAVSRRVTGHGLPGSIVWVQHITLWIGFLGAILSLIATGGRSVSRLGCNDYGQASFGNRLFAPGRPGR